MKKIALLVSKEPHCLEQLIEDFQHGRLHGEIAGVYDLGAQYKKMRLKIAANIAGYSDLI